MTLSLRPKLRGDIIFRRVEDDFVIYDPVTDRTAFLNLSAAVVVDLCDGTRTPDEIAQESSAAFSVDKANIIGGVEQVIHELTTHGFLAMSV